MSKYIGLYNLKAEQNFNFQMMQGNPYS